LKCLGQTTPVFNSGGSARQGLFLWNLDEIGQDNNIFGAIQVGFWKQWAEFEDHTQTTPKKAVHITKTVVVFPVHGF
jgi:hypothetical protein